MVQSVGNRLTTTIIRQAEKSGYFCAAGKMPVNPVVHELRKSFKRLRALLRFYIELSEHPAGLIIKEIRQYGRLLAPLRESAVNIELFNKEIAKNKLFSERKIKAARELLVQRNKFLIENSFVRNNMCGNIHKYLEGLIQGFGVQPAALTKVHFFREVSRSYLKSIACYQQLGPDPHPEQLHSLRKRMKRLFYQIDFLRFLHPKFFKLKTNQLNKINDQLGNDHDLYIFFTEINSGICGFNADELFILDNQVDHLRELNQLKLYPKLKQFFIMAPSEFDQKMEEFFKL